MHKNLDNIHLRVNGKTDASLADDPTQLLLGHLPMVLHPDAKSVLIIGFGSGMTAGAVAAWPVSHIDVVELEAAVLDASRFFVRENRDVLSDPRVHVTITDGRNFLLRS